jgi:L,D-peptidoglycan transpeptidase YkuD (ErfK/YbiS/YcfS/YnhG family)
LPVRPIHESDGWCDDPKSPYYNRLVKRPYAFSHELLWRDDRMYDVVIPMGYNDDPVVAGKGSAIFMHIAKPGYLGTEGCVALALEDMLELLPSLNPQSRIEIRKE